MTTLITGGLGFIGLHTARSMLDLGEDVVLTQYRVTREPDFIKDELGKRAKVEQLDVTDKARLMEIGRTHKIDRIVHLAVPALGALTPLEDFTVNMSGLINILEAGREWECKPYRARQLRRRLPGRPRGRRRQQGRASGWRRRAAAPREPGRSASRLSATTTPTAPASNIVMLRIAGIYGPLYHSMSNLPSRLVHAAVKGEPPVLRGDTYAEDGNDATYVKDCGRGIAMLMQAEKLNHNVYNVASGVATSAGEMVSEIRKAIPSFKGDFLKEGRTPGSPGTTHADISRIKADTGYAPQYLGRQVDPGLHRLAARRQR